MMMGMKQRAVFLMTIKSNSTLRCDLQFTLTTLSTMIFNDIQYEKFETITFFHLYLKFCCDQTQVLILMKKRERNNSMNMIMFCKDLPSHLKLFRKITKVAAHLCVESYHSIVTVLTCEHS